MAETSGTNDALMAGMQEVGSGIDRVLAERDEARAALRDLFALVEDGTLVRNASRDDEPGWPLKAMRLVMVLKRAAEASGRTP